MTPTVSSGVTTLDDFVIDDDEVEIRTISSDQGEIETYVYKKQFRGGRWEF
jgi:hypothetical protein